MKCNWKSRWYEGIESLGSCPFYIVFILDMTSLHMVIALKTLLWLSYVYLALPSHLDLLQCIGMVYFCWAKWNFQTTNLLHWFRCSGSKVKPLVEAVHWGLSYNQLRCAEAHWSSDLMTRRAGLGQVPRFEAARRTQELIAPWSRFVAMPCQRFEIKQKMHHWIFFMNLCVMFQVHHMTHLDTVCTMNIQFNIWLTKVHPLRRSWKKKWPKHNISRWRPAAVAGRLQEPTIRNNC